MSDIPARPFIAGRAWLSYQRGHMVRLLSSLLVALALLLSPLAMIGGGGAAHAATPQMAASSAHCAEEGPAPASEKQTPGMKAGCAIACAAVAATQPVPAPPMLPAERVRLAAVDQHLSGIRPEGETPPPRIASEI